jgi:thiamine-monophosphate kinase
MPDERDDRPRDGSEAARIAALIASLPRGDDASVVLGPGDDAAVVRPREGRDLVVTTDTFVEGRHFRRDLLTPSEIGGRLAAANLSDMAAMAAEPRWAVLSLVVPAAWSAGDALLIERACARAFRVDGASVVGGNLASGDGAFSATVTLLGDVERERAWKRAGARPGDLLAVTGFPGSAAAFVALALWGNPPARARVPGALTERFIAPASRIALARALADAGGVHAAIDISDGLAADLARLASASAVGARVMEELLPSDEPMRAAVRALSAAAGQERGPLPAGEGDLLSHLQLGPSDDYELLLAVDPAAWDQCEALAAEHGAPLTLIGGITSGSALERVERGGGSWPLDPRGWDHFEK